MIGGGGGPVVVSCERCGIPGTDVMRPVIGDGGRFACRAGRSGGDVGGPSESAHVASGSTGGGSGTEGGAQVCELFPPIIPTAGTAPTALPAVGTGGGPTTGAPQFPQKRLSGASCAPHSPQSTIITSM